MGDYFTKKTFNLPQHSDKAEIFQSTLRDVDNATDMCTVPNSTSIAWTEELYIKPPLELITLGINDCLTLWIPIIPHQKQSTDPKIGDTRKCILFPPT